jgi:peptide/nickel transport system permease protein
MGLRTYVIRRLILIIPTFFTVSLIVFMIIHLAPNDPVEAMQAGAPGRISQEMAEKIRKELGLDQPIHIQYLMWVTKLLRGDLGYSYLTAEPVGSTLAGRIPRTIELMLTAQFISWAIAIVLGVVAAVKQYSLADVLSSVTALIGFSTPNFWIGLILLLIFSLRLGWLPASGVHTPGITFASPFHALIDHLKYLLLPTLVLVIGWTAYLFRIVRSSMLEVLKQDYITTARAKGLKERVVIYKHALRNALLPVISYLGLSVGFLLGGSAVIETLFAWPGLGQLMVERALMSDYNVLMGISIIVAIMVLIANLCADIAYAVVDPRIRYD